MLEKKRKRANGRDTYFKLYIHSEPGGRTARRESELLFGSGRKVCVWKTVSIPPQLEPTCSVQQVHAVTV